MLNNYLSLEQLRFKNKFDFNIKVDKKIDIYDTQVPPLIIQPFVENAVIHGLKDKKENGLIKVEFTQKNDQLLAVIQDNGIGIYTAQKEALNNKEFLRKSVGIELTKQRLQLVQTNVKDDFFNIEETRSGGKVTGTKISLVI